jgi:hypothetical protein
VIGGVGSYPRTENGDGIGPIRFAHEGGGDGQLGIGAQWGGGEFCGKLGEQLAGLGTTTGTGEGLSGEEDGSLNLLVVGVKGEQAFDGLGGGVEASEIGGNQGGLEEGGFDQFGLDRGEILVAFADFQEVGEGGRGLF